MSALIVLRSINRIIGILFLLCYSYQLLYVPVALLHKKRAKAAASIRRYAVLISARNEEAVIGHLLDSIRQQDYSQENLDVYVVADNCTDNTAGAAREAGAIVYRRSDRVHVG